MKKICFVTLGILPVPATQGGAVEQLVQQLCEDNERDPRLEITCVTLYGKEAARRQEAYRHTRFVNVRTGGRPGYWINRKIHGLVRHATGKDIPFVYLYAYERNRHRAFQRRARAFRKRKAEKLVGLGQ